MILSIKHSKTEFLVNDQKLIFGFVSLDLIPLEAHFRQARQKQEIEVMELDEGMVQWGLRAAAMKMSFLPTRVGMGTDVLKYNPEIKPQNRASKVLEIILKDTLQENTTYSFNFGQSIVDWLWGGFTVNNANLVLFVKIGLSALSCSKISCPLLFFIFIELIII